MKIEHFCEIAQEKNFFLQRKAYYMPVAVLFKKTKLFHERDGDLECFAEFKMRNDEKDPKL